MPDSLISSLPREPNFLHLFVSDSILESDGFPEAVAKSSERVPRVNKGKFLSLTGTLGHVKVMRSWPGPLVIYRASGH